MPPVLCIVSPCFNEEQVLPITSKLFLNELEILIKNGSVSEDSRILFVDDGSSDKTLEIIKRLADENKHFCGISLSRNCGHQNALFAGLMEAMGNCDVTVSLDCDGQDDIKAIEKMLDEYQTGSEIVYGVRNRREKDTFFKRNTAAIFYRIMNTMGTELVPEHADFRLISSRALRELEKFGEVNLFLRGLIPQIGFKSSIVEYERNERLAGESRYPLKKMMSLASDGITSFSTKPLRMITSLGIIISVISFIGTIWAVVEHIIGGTADGWASLACMICFLGGIQLVSLGVIGEYIGKIYMEVKHRPRYIIEKRINK